MGLVSHAASLQCGEAHAYALTTRNGSGGGAGGEGASGGEGAAGAGEGGGLQSSEVQMRTLSYPQPLRHPG